MTHWSPQQQARRQITPRVVGCIIVGDTECRGEYVSIVDVGNEFTFDSPNERTNVNLLPLGRHAPTAPRCLLAKRLDVDECATPWGGLTLSYSYAACWSSQREDHQAPRHVASDVHPCAAWGCWLYARRAPLPDCAQHAAPRGTYAPCTPLANCQSRKLEADVHC